MAADDRIRIAFCVGGRVHAAEHELGATLVAGAPEPQRPALLAARIYLEIEPRAAGVGHLSAVVLGGSKLDNRLSGEHLGHGKVTPE